MLRVLKKTLTSSKTVILLVVVLCGTMCFLFLWKDSQMKRNGRSGPGQEGPGRRGRPTGPRRPDTCTTNDTTDKDNEGRSGPGQERPGRRGRPTGPRRPETTNDTTDKDNEGRGKKNQLTKIRRKPTVKDIVDYRPLIHPFNIYLPNNTAGYMLDKDLLHVFNDVTFENKSLFHRHSFNRVGTSRLRPFDAQLPIIYVITPTYTRQLQKAELSHMCATLRHVGNLVWIVVEDSRNKTDLVVNFLSRCGVLAVHVNIKSTVRPELTVVQRNSALQWIRDYVNVTARDCVFYFADDDNTYDPEVFEQMRYTQKVSVWPVGFASNAPAEMPIVEDGKVVDWVSGYDVKERKFPIDMAGFAINVHLLHEHPEARFSYSMKTGHLETKFLERFDIDNEDFEPRANNCTEVLVWHTQRNKTNLHLPKRTKMNKTVVRPWPEV